MSTGCLILLSAACLHQATPGPSKTPMPADLIKLVPNIKSEDGKYQTIEVSGFFKETGSLHLRFQATYRKPGDFRLLVTDGIDGTPLLCATSRKILFYDPIRPVLLFTKRMGMSLEFLSVENKLSINFSGESDESKCGHIDVDLKSLLDSPGADSNQDEVVVTGDQTYRLIRTGEHGGTLATCIDMKQACPVTSMKLFLKGSHDAVFGFDKIVIDGPLDDGALRFPDVARLAQSVSVEDHSDVGVFRMLGDFAAIMKSLRVRMAAQYPALRPSVRLGWGRRVDWNRIKANDEKYSASLKAEMMNPGSPPDRPVAAKPPAR